MANFTINTFNIKNNRNFSNQTVLKLQVNGIVLKLFYLNVYRICQK